MAGWRDFPAIRYQQGRYAIPLYHGAGRFANQVPDRTQPAGAKVQRQLRQAAAMIKAFGGEVLPGTNATVADITSGIKASISNLQRRGYEVARPGQPVHPRVHPSVAQRES